MARREFSRKIKNEALRRAGMKCEATGPAFGFKEGQRCNCSLSLGVQFDHILPDQLGGEPTLENCQALCVQCHKFKSRDDIKRIRKSDRQRDKGNGVVRPKGQIKSPGFAKSSKSANASRHDWAPKFVPQLFAPKETT